MLTYADVCVWDALELKAQQMLLSADACRRMLAYADVC
jgi:hypothetical protein